ncbi:hypothetical protein B9T07_18715 [Limnospira fusiformis CCALA 023]|uniref:tetratricopeptide repeat protein n=1 Tax=Limnospira platensis TaxID=118562 RepID=UPI00396EBC43
MGLSLYEYALLIKNNEFDQLSSFDRYHSRLQINFILDYNQDKFFGIEMKKKNCDFIGRFESLNTDFKLLCDRLNIKFQSLPHFRKDLDTRHYSQFYDRETFKIVREIYANDIEKLNYQDDCKLLDMIIDIKQSSDFKYLNFAGKLEQDKKFSQAITIYQVAIDKNPDFSWYYRKLGDVFARLGNLEQAIISYRRAIQVNPNSAYCYYSLGNLLFDQGNKEEATALYRRSVEINPSCALYSKTFGLPKTVNIDDQNQLFTVQLNKGSGLGNGV